MTPAPPANLPPSAGPAGPEEVLRRLDLTVTRRLDGLLQGDYLGLVPGHGSDLGETRPYQPGDDVRRIDWNVTARMQTPYVRQTIADRELESWVLLDFSPSLDFGTAYCEKRDLAISAAAAVGFLTARTGNRFGALLLGPDGATTIPARGGRNNLMAAMHQIVTVPRGREGRTDLTGGVRRLDAMTHRRGLCVVISDFLHTDGWEIPLRHLAHRHETLAVEVVDPRELELPDVGLLRLVDPRTGELREVQTANAKLRARFAAAAAEQRTTIAGHLQRTGVDHLQLRTDRDWLLDLVRFVVARRERQAEAARGALS